jgi:hypothetical protein
MFRYRYNVDESVRIQTLVSSEVDSMIAIEVVGQKDRSCAFIRPTRTYGIVMSNEYPDCLGIHIFMFLGCMERKVGPLTDEVRGSRLYRS